MLSILSHVYVGGWKQCPSVINDHICSQGTSENDCVYPVNWSLAPFQLWKMATKQMWICNTSFPWIRILNSKITVTKYSWNLKAVPVANPKWTVYRYGPVYLDSKSSDTEPYL